MFGKEMIRMSAFIRFTFALFNVFQPLSLDGPLRKTTAAKRFMAALSLAAKVLN